MQPRLDLTVEGCDLCGEKTHPTAGKACKLRLFSYLFVNSSWCIVTSTVIFFSIDRSNYLLLLAIEVVFEMNRTPQK